jgi:hypothetical protein
MLLDQRWYLTQVRESTETLLGEDQRAVELYLEHAPAARVQAEITDGAPIFVDQLFRQTDGIGEVASNDAKLD